MIDAESGGQACRRRHAIPRETKHTIDSRRPSWTVSRVREGITVHHRRAAWRLAALLVGGALVACGGGDRPGQSGQAEGPLRLIDGPAWVVGQQLVTVPPEAVVSGKPTVGATVKVTGTWGEAGELIVRRAEIAAPAAPSAATAPPAAAASVAPASTSTTAPAATPTAPPPTAAPPTATARPAAPAAPPVVRPAPPAAKPARPAPAPDRRRGQDREGEED